MKLTDKAKNLPLAPGVYYFLGKNKEILYIGRATSLRRRVAQYFQKKLEPRIAEMVSQARDLKFKPTETLLEAIILEANEIKKHWPKYNVKDKDDRSFIYVVIPKIDYSHPLIVRQRELKKFPPGRAQVFGPYQNANLLKNALRLIRRIFPYGTCRPNSGKACFDYQIGLCPGSCIGLISKKDYQKNIASIALLLAGRKKQLIKKLKKDNPESIKALNQLQEVTLITRDELSGNLSTNRLEGYDISHLAGKETVGAMAVFSGGEPDKSQYRLFNIKTAAASDDLRALAEMFSRRLNHREWPLPDLFVIDGGKPQVDFIYHLCQEKNLSLPLIGISKFGGDKLVFAPGTSKSVRQLAENLKETLLKLRDEAHRFSNRARKRKMRIE